MDRKQLRKWHVWLGWLVGVPILIWTVSGLVMVWKPIEEVRGSHLLESPEAVRLAAAPVLPEGLENEALTSLSLEQRANGPVWVVAGAQGTRLADPATGQWLEPLGEGGALAEVAARYAGEGRGATVETTDPADPPTDWRRESAAYAVTYDNGDRFYVDPATGQIAATRSSWWRVFDFMWGLHIMDLQTREDTNNPWIVTFAAIGVGTTILAMILLPMATGKKKRKKRRAEAAARAAASAKA